MLRLIYITFMGIIRDRVFQGIMTAAVLLPFIPSISSLSMRQVSELSLTLSLSLISFILLLLSVFLGGTSLWTDVERRYSFSVLGLPVTRASYLLGKFSGIAGFIALTTTVLGIIACIVIWYVAGAYPPSRPIIWFNIFFTLLFDAAKYIMLVAIAFLLSTVSTSFFLPIFGTISAFLVGGATQQVYEFVRSSSGQAFSPAVKSLIIVLYYILPNFSAFDLKTNAIYGIDLSVSGLLLTAAYFIIYTAILLTLASILFSRRELK